MAVVNSSTRYSYQTGWQTRSPWIHRVPVTAFICPADKTEKLHAPVLPRSFLAKTKWDIWYPHFYCPAIFWICTLLFPYCVPGFISKHPEIASQVGAKSCVGLYIGRGNYKLKSILVITYSIKKTEKKSTSFSTSSSRAVICFLILRGHRRDRRQCKPVLS